MLWLRRNTTRILIVLLATLAISHRVAPAAEFKSHPPQRPLPIASQRPLGNGSAQYVDATRGDDANSGSKSTPWKSIAHAVTKLKPGDTLLLSGGTYYENVVCRVSGTAQAPITIRSGPGEIAIIDAGFREFLDEPANAWEPYPKGAADEFRSTKKYPKLERAAGNFGDSLIPLNAYQRELDFRSDNENSDRQPDGSDSGRWFGPGLWYDTQTERIHVRLAHTHIKAFGKNNYQGQTDPRKLPLIVTGLNRTPLHLENVAHVHVQDIVLRGGGENTVLVRKSRNITLDNITLYIANRGLRVETTSGLKVFRTAFRGPMPPWGSRTVSKYRTFDSHLFVPVGTLEIRRELRKSLQPQCRDFELAYNEFTDGHDGAYVGGVLGMNFHHNLVDNLNDDGVYISAWGPPGKNLRIYQNRISRCLTAFAFGLGRYSASDPSPGVHIFRNFVDLRGPVPYGHPGKTEPPAITSFGRISGDHGGPTWDPMFVYHNTFLMKSPQMRGYPHGWGGHMNKTSRRVFNNIFVETERLTGARSPATNLDFQTDGNLSWSFSDGANFDGDFFAAFRNAKILETTRKRYPPGWAANSRFGDPRFVNAPKNWPDPGDIRIRKGSPAINAGVPIPTGWPDPLRNLDKGKPDIGALPLGAKPFVVGRAASP
jgi:hypothetical protein